MTSISDMTVLITGGTGSFGSRMVNHLLSQGCQRIHVLSRDEEKQDLMRHRLKDERVRYFLGDIRDYDSVNRAARDTTHIFHAAALKVVPSCEFFPMQAVRTNILGSRNVIDAAEANGVKSVVCLSTDKAVYPINAMGQSKALMEKVAQAHGLEFADAKTTVSIVRYGNVLYSRGSVVPLFIRQIKEGKKLTVTNPNMTRFLMTLDQSVDLVLYAFTNAEQGDLFVRKVPACTIGDLAIAVSELFGGDPDYTVIGDRHGEKLSEQLATREELMRSTDHGNYFRIRADKRDLNYAKFFTEGTATRTNYSDYDSHTVPRLNVEQVKELLLTLPEVQYELEHWG
ncbi:MAG: SDR family NAD(P)-dependent oxidoreductase [Actinomycetaceae bacterium]|nr:SDR family NAD(P)-dependent oxidoreductase [Actinomycetaceae bacterium]